MWPLLFISWRINDLLVSGHMWPSGGFYRFLSGDHIVVRTAYHLGSLCGHSDRYRICGHMWPLNRPGRRRPGICAGAWKVWNHGEPRRRDRRGRDKLRLFSRLSCGRWLSRRFAYCLHLGVGRELDNLCRLLTRDRRGCQGFAGARSR